MKYTTFIGLDVHKETITAARANREGGPAESIGTIPNNPDAISKLVKKLGKAETLRFCYEAGPCGYGIYRQLNRLGASCIVVAPSLIPTKPGERIKNDRRDAQKLARLLRSGDLTPVWVPDEHQEALRDLLRAREDACQDLLRKRQQLGKFLLRMEIRPGQKMRAWTIKYREWLNSLQFEEYARQIVFNEYMIAITEAESRVRRLEETITEYVNKHMDNKIIKALQALRGVGLITAATLVAELGDITRFKNPKQLMSYAGIVPGEHSSGEKRRLGRITRTGNAHVRFVAVEAAWHYRYKPSIGEKLKKRQEGLSGDIIAISWKAQHRLNKKFRKMEVRGKSRQVAAVAIGRELLGFIWAIAMQVNKEIMEAA